jgi:hypothetical protein
MVAAAAGGAAGALAISRRPDDGLAAALASLGVGALMLDAGWLNVAILVANALSWQDDPVTSFGAVGMWIGVATLTLLAPSVRWPAVVLAAVGVGANVASAWWSVRAGQSANERNRMERNLWYNAVYKNIWSEEGA